MNLPSDAQVRPVGNGVGVKVERVDLAACLEAQDISWIPQLVVDKSVVVFPRQFLTNKQQVALTRSFGQPQTYPVTQYVGRTQPEVMRISNMRADDQLIGLQEDDSFEEWHTDGSWNAVNTATLLYSVVSPSEGGATRFANTTQAYNDLSDEDKKLIEPLRAVHSMKHLVSLERERNPDKPPLTPEEEERMPDVSQPLAPAHPETGKRSLLLGSHIVKEIEGHPSAWWRPLLDRLLRHATQDTYVYTHTWADGDLVIWDNRATMHTRTACDSERFSRLLYRTTAA